MKEPTDLEEAVEKFKQALENYDWDKSYRENVLFPAWRITCAYLKSIGVSIFPKEKTRPRKPNFKRIILERDNWTCQKCGSTEREKMCVDHIIPFSKGGTETLDNLQTLCRSCNSKKGARIEVLINYDATDNQNL